MLGNWEASILSIWMMDSLKRHQERKKEIGSSSESGDALQDGDKKAFWGATGTVASGSTDPNKKTKYACIVEAHVSTRKRLESTRPRNHQDHIAEKKVSIQ